MAKTLAQAQKVEINQEIKAMAGNDYSGMTTNIHDNAVVTFGDVSDTVAQTINQLPQENGANKETLKELLTKLQTLIEKAEELEQSTKIDALKHVSKSRHQSQCHR